MSKKYLQIIALSAIMGSFGGSAAIGKACSEYKGLEKTDEVNCKKEESCYWEGGSRPCKSIPENCANFSPQACAFEAYQKYCYLNKESKKCEVLEKNKPKINKTVDNKTIEKKKGNVLNEDSASKKTPSNEAPCTTKWFKGTCNNAKSNSCIYLNSKKNAGQKSGCHNVDFYIKNKAYFDIDSSSTDSFEGACNKQFDFSCYDDCRSTHGTAMTPKLQDCFNNCKSLKGKCLGLNPKKTLITITQESCKSKDMQCRLLCRDIPEITTDTAALGACLGTCDKNLSDCLNKVSK